MFCHLDVFLGGVSLIDIEKQNGGVNRSMRFVQCFGRQLLENLESLSGVTLHIKCECICHRAIQILGRAIVCLLGQFLRLFCVLIDA